MCHKSLTGWGQIFFFSQCGGKSKNALTPPPPIGHRNYGCARYTIVLVLSSNFVHQGGEGLKNGKILRMTWEVQKSIKKIFRSNFFSQNVVGSPTRNQGLMAHLIYLSALLSHGICSRSPPESGSDWLREIT